MCARLLCYTVHHRHSPEHSGRDLVCPKSNRRQCSFLVNAAWFLLPLPRKEKFYIIHIFIWEFTTRTSALNFFGSGICSCETSHFLASWFADGTLFVDPQTYEVCLWAAWPVGKFYIICNQLPALCQLLSRHVFVINTNWGYLLILSYLDRVFHC